MPGVIIRSRRAFSSVKLPREILDLAGLVSISSDFAGESSRFSAILLEKEFRRLSPELRLSETAAEARTPIRWKVRRLERFSYSGSHQLLDAIDVNDNSSENSRSVCPGIVSCADILVSPARESVVLAGGPFYPLLTGRRDSNASFAEIAPDDDDLSKALNKLGSRGFDKRETVILLGSHSIGMVHCHFFKNRLFNFNNTVTPDPSVDPEFLNDMGSVCSDSEIPPTSHPSISPSSQSLLPAQSPFSTLPLSTSQSPEPSHHDLFSSFSKNSGLRMDYMGPGEQFGGIYYRSLLQNRGILFVDQQFTSEEETRSWVEAYAKSTPLFRRDYAVTMMKLSNLKVLTAPQGLVRRHCARID